MSSAGQGCRHTRGGLQATQRWWIIVAPDSKESAPPKRRLPLGGSSAALAGKGEEKGITSGTEQGRKEAKQEVRGERLLRVRANNKNENHVSV